MACAAFVLVMTSFPIVFSSNESDLTTPEDRNVGLELVLPISLGVLLLLVLSTMSLAVFCKMKAYNHFTKGSNRRKIRREDIQVVVEDPQLRTFPDLSTTTETIANRSSYHSNSNPGYYSNRKSNNNHTSNHATSKQPMRLPANALNQKIKFGVNKPDDVYFDETSHCQAGKLARQAHDAAITAVASFDAPDNDVLKTEKDIKNERESRISSCGMAVKKEVLRRRDSGGKDDRSVGRKMEKYVGNNKDEGGNTGGDYEIYGNFNEEEINKINILSNNNQSISNPSNKVTASTTDDRLNDDKSGVCSLSSSKPAITNNYNTNKSIYNKTNQPNFNNTLKSNSYARKTSFGEISIGNFSKQDSESSYSGVLEYDEKLRMPQIFNVKNKSFLNEIDNRLKHKRDIMNNNNESDTNRTSPASSGITIGNYSVFNTDGNTSDVFSNGSSNMHWLSNKGDGKGMNTNENTKVNSFLDKETVSQELVDDDDYQRLPCDMINNNNNNKKNNKSSNKINNNNNNDVNTANNRINVTNITNDINNNNNNNTKDSNVNCNIINHNYNTNNKNNDISVSNNHDESLNLEDKSRYEEETFECTVCHSYTAQHDDDISIATGDVIVVNQKLDNGWWRGMRDGKEGFFPGNYVTIKEEAVNDDLTERTKSSLIELSEAKKVEGLLKGVMDEGVMDEDTILRKKNTKTERYGQNTLSKFLNKKLTGFTEAVKNGNVSETWKRRFEEDRGTRLERVRSTKKAQGRKKAPEAPLSNRATLLFSNLFQRKSLDSKSLKTPTIEMSVLDSFDGLLDGERREQKPQRRLPAEIPFQNDTTDDIYANLSEFNTLQLPPKPARHQSQVHKAFQKSAAEKLKPKLPKRQKTKSLTNLHQVGLSIPSTPEDNWSSKFDTMQPHSKPPVSSKPPYNAMRPPLKQWKSKIEVNSSQSSNDYTACNSVLKPPRTNKKEDSAKELIVTKPDRRTALSMEHAGATKALSFEEELKSRFKRKQI